ncbi:hypothetical protein HK102_005625, partial [Quaeritorhiza haematococci]
MMINTLTAAPTILANPASEGFDPDSAMLLAWSNALNAFNGAVGNNPNVGAGTGGVVVAGQLLGGKQPLMGLEGYQQFMLQQQQLVFGHAMGNANRKKEEGGGLLQKQQQQQLDQQEQDQQSDQQKEQEESQSQSQAMDDSWLSLLVDDIAKVDEDASSVTKSPTSATSCSTATSFDDFDQFPALISNSPTSSPSPTSTISDPASPMSTCSLSVTTTTTGNGSGNGNNSSNGSSNGTRSNGGGSTPPLDDFLSDSTLSPLLPPTIFEEPCTPCSPVDDFMNFVSDAPSSATYPATTAVATTTTATSTTSKGSDASTKDVALAPPSMTLSTSFGSLLSVDPWQPYQNFWDPSSSFLGEQPLLGDQGFLNDVSSEPPLSPATPTTSTTTPMLTDSPTLATTLPTPTTPPPTTVAPSVFAAAAGPAVAESHQQQRKFTFTSSYTPISPKPPTIDTTTTNNTTNLAPKSSTSIPVPPMASPSSLSSTTCPSPSTSTSALTSASSPSAPTSSTDAFHRALAAVAANGMARRWRRHSVGPYPSPYSYPSIAQIEDILAAAGRRPSTASSVSSGPGSPCTPTSA